MLHIVILELELKSKSKWQSGLTHKYTHTHTCQFLRHPAQRLYSVQNVGCVVNCLALLMKGFMTVRPVFVPCIMQRSISGCKVRSYLLVHLQVISGTSVYKTHTGNYFNKSWDTQKIFFGGFFVHIVVDFLQQHIIFFTKKNLFWVRRMLYVARLVRLQAFSIHSVNV